MLGWPSRGLRKQTSRDEMSNYHSTNFTDKKHEDGSLERNRKEFP